MKNYFYLLCIIALLFFSPAKSFAKAYGWLISTTQNKAQKLDIDANTIYQAINPSESLRTSVELQNIDSALIASPSNNLLFAVYDKSGRHSGQGVKAYDLKQLSFKKDLGIISKDPDNELPKIIIPPVGTNLYLVWWDNSKGVKPDAAVTYSIFSKSSLNKVGDQKSFPADVSDHIYYSSDGTKLYSISLDVNDMNVFDGSTLQMAETISFTNLWGSPSFGKGVEYYSNNRILFAENLKMTASDSDNYKYFIYDVSAKKASQKISISETGYGVLSRDGSKIIIVEIAATSSNSNNKISIYDSASGKNLKHIDFNSRYKQIRRLRGDTISPDGSKLYLMAKSVQTGSSTLIIVDLKTNFSVIAEIPNVEASWMIFF